MAWGGKREGAGRPMSSMAGIMPRLLRTARTLPDGLGIELLQELRAVTARLDQAGSRQAEMVRALITALRQAFRG